MYPGVIYLENVLIAYSIGLGLINWLLVYRHVKSRIPYRKNFLDIVSSSLALTCYGSLWLLKIYTSNFVVENVSSAQIFLFLVFMIFFIYPFLVFLGFVTNGDGVAAYD